MGGGGGGGGGGDRDVKRGGKEKKRNIDQGWNQAPMRRRLYHSIQTENAFFVNLCLCSTAHAQ